MPTLGTLALTRFTTWTVFNDGWFVTINNNTPVTFEALKETFGAKGQAQYIDYLNNNTGP